MTGYYCIKPFNIDNIKEFILKINIKYVDTEIKIEDLEIEDNSNILVYYNNDVKGEEFINIYSGVRVLITSEYTINEDRWEFLPSYIEYVIICDDRYENNIIYELKGKFNFEMMKFMSCDKFEEYIDDIIEVDKKKLEEQNKNGETILMIMCWNYMTEKKKKKILDMIDDEVFDKIDKRGMIALEYMLESPYYQTQEIIVNTIIRRTKEKWYKKENVLGQSMLMLFICNQLYDFESFNDIMMKYSIDEIKRGEYLISAINYDREVITTELIKRLKDANEKDEITKYLFELNEKMPELYYTLKNSEII